jgi:hypothetical protein
MVCRGNTTAFCPCTPHSKSPKKVPFSTVTYIVHILLKTLQASSMPPTFARHVQKVVCYLSGIMIIQFIVVENNGGQKVVITAWQFSAFSRSPEIGVHPLSYHIPLIVQALGRG